jgi:hypothetical protein
VAFLRYVSASALRVCDGPQQRLRRATGCAAYGVVASTLPQRRGMVTHAARSGPMLHSSRGGDGRPHEGHAQAELELQGRHPEARPASSSTEVGMRSPPKDDARSDRRGAADGGSGSASVRPGRTALSARWTNVRLQGKGLLLGLGNPLALLMKLGVALARTCGAGRLQTAPTPQILIFRSVGGALASGVILRLLGVRCLKQPALI